MFTAAAPFLLIPLIFGTTTAPAPLLVGQEGNVYDFRASFERNNTYTDVVFTIGDREYTVLLPPREGRKHRAAVAVIGYTLPNEVVSVQACTQAPQPVCTARIAVDNRVEVK